MSGPAQIIFSGAQDVTPLGGIDGALGRAEILPGARLHLHKHQLRSIPSDQIYFAATVAGSVVARDHSITEFTEMSID